MMKCYVCEELANLLSGPSVWRRRDDWILIRANQPCVLYGIGGSNPLAPTKTRKGPAPYKALVLFHASGAGSPSRLRRFGHGSIRLR